MLSRGQSLTCRYDNFTVTETQKHATTKMKIKLQIVMPAFSYQ